MSAGTGRRYEFGPFQLDTGDQVLRQENRPVHLTPKAYDTLLALVSRQGQMLSKDDLMRIVWANIVVEENNLNQQISLLRRVLGPRPDGGPYIETLPRRGYKFTAQVKEIGLPDTRPAPAAGAAPRPHRVLATRVLAASLALTVAAAAWFFVTRKHTLRASADTASIVVLPFAFIEGQDDERDLPATLAAALSRKLEGRGLRLRLERATSGPGTTRRTEEPLLRGRALGADYVLDGRLVRQGAHIEGLVYLLATADGAPRWSGRFEIAHATMSATEDSLADGIARAITSAPSQVNSPIDRRRTAQEAYEKGRYFWGKRSSVGLDRAISHFKQAIAADPAYAPAHAGLAAAQAFDASYWPQAEASARKALELDPNQADGHAVVGFIRLFWQWRWDDAHAALTRAVALDRQNATARQWYAIWLMSVERGMEALAEMSEALRLDPFSTIIRADLAQIRYFNGEHAEAIALCRQALDADPDFVVAWLYLYDIYTLAGRYAEAVDAFAKASEILQNHTIYNRGRVPALRRAFEGGGMRAFWQEVIDVPEPNLDPYIAAEHLARLGETDRALRALGKAYDARHFSLLFLRASPVFTAMRGDPRFRELVQRIGIPAVGGAHPDRAKRREP